MAKPKITFKEKQYNRFIELWEEMDDEWKHKAEAEIKNTQILDILAEAQLTDVVTFGDLYEDIKRRQKYFNKAEGMGVGLKYFDDATMGFRPGEVTVIAGPSNFGKTAIGLNIITSLVVNTLKKAIIVSLEMTTEEILSRNYNMADEPQHEIMKDRIIVQKHRRISAPYIGRIIERNKPDIVFVDHLQFLANRERGEEYERVSKAMAEIKNLALEYMIPIIIVSHVNKNRSGKHGEAANADLKGSCLAEGTKVLTNRGYISIENVQIDDRVLSINNQLHSETDKVVMTKYMGEKDVYEITTNLGRKIRATKDHKFFNGLEWQTLGEIAVGDYLTSFEKPQIKHQSIADNLTWLIIGWLIGDGSIVPYGQQLSVASLGEVNLLTQLCEGSPYHIQNGGFRKGVYQVYISTSRNIKQGSTLLHKILKEDDLRHKSLNKHLGKSIFSASKNNKIHLLRGLFHADGSLSVNKTGGACVSLSSVSYKIVADAQLLLRQLGIGSKLKSLNISPDCVILGKPRKRQTTMYSLTLHGSSVRKFMHSIGFLGEKQLLALEKMKRAGKPISSLTEQRLPDYIGELIKKDIDDSKVIDGKTLIHGHPNEISWAKLGYRPKVNWHKAPLRGKIQNIFLDSDILWEKIKSIEYIGKAKTYDIQTANNHNFMAEGFVTHNSAIEQDADIVLMINRPKDDAQAGNDVILTLTKHRTKRPNIFLKDCLLRFDGIRIADKGAYGLYNQ